jgi:hypothetical protein
MVDTADFREKRWLALILLCSAQFVVVLDASIVNVALPTIGKALDGAVAGSGGAPACCSGECSPTASAGSGCSGSTCRSA